MNKIISALVIMTMAVGACFFVAERADARGLAKLILSPIAKIIGKGSGAASGASYNGPVLSRAELRRCLQLRSGVDESARKLETAESSLNVYDDKIKKAENQIRPLENEVDSLRVRIDAEEPLVNLRSQQSVDNYNALIEKYKSAARKYNSMASDINVLIETQKGKVSQHNGSVNAHNLSVSKIQSECSPPYRQSDMDAILAEKQTDVRQ